MAQWHLLQSRLSKATSTIAVRLRLVFLMIGLVTAGSGIVALLQAKTILKAHTELNQFALPMLTLAQRTERDLNAMFLVLESINAYRTTAELEDVKTDITRKTDRVRRNLNSLREFDVSVSIIEDLDRRLVEAQASSFSVVKHHTILLTLQDEVRETLDRLATLEEKSQRILDEMSFDTTSQMDTLIRSNDIDSLVFSQGRDDKINALFIASLNISSIGHGLDSIHSLSTNQGISVNTETSSRTRLLINAKIQDVTNRLSLLPDVPARRDLARYINEIRILLSKEGDYFTRVLSRFQFEKEYENNRATHLPLMLEISGMSTALVDRTLALVKSTSQRLDAAVYQLIWVLSVAFLTALITIILTNHGVIERQFNTRIKTLNHSVSAIAEGNLEYPIAISGSDELGDMARALAVFKQTAEDLQHSNVELEKFAYVAAHDLRSPLRAIHDLSSWITEDEENTLSGESRAYITLLQERVGRLNKLLNDLLAYARVGQDVPKPENIDLTLLITEQAQYADPENHYQIKYIGDPIWIFTQRTPLQQIISNLLNNAVKHHDRENGNITVSVTCVGAMLSLAIKDDGPGIEPRYQEKIFELFQTLRPRDEVEGSGLGLAIVKKLTARQKGKITLFSNPVMQRGTTFEVILPLAQVVQKTTGRKTAVAA